MHLDYLETKLEFNLGEVDGFPDLDTQSQVDLADLAVKYDLDREATQNILNVCQSLRSLADG